MPDTSTRRLRTGIVLFDDIEVLDYCGPYEVFSVTRLDASARREEPSPFEVLLVAEHDRPVSTSGGMRVLPDTTLATCPALDILVVPGGWGSRREMHAAPMLDFVRRQAAQVQTLTSVCTGALILASAGLLDGKRATTHWRSLDMLAQQFPAVQVDRQLHVVQDGCLFTCAGISAGIDMALYVVAHHLGETVARATARQMEYPYPDTLQRRIDPASA